MPLYLQTVKGDSVKIVHVQRGETRIISSLKYLHVSISIVFTSRDKEIPKNLFLWRKYVHTTI